MKACRSAFRRLVAAVVAALPLVGWPAVLGESFAAEQPTVSPVGESARIITVQSGTGGGPGRHHRKIPKPQPPPVDNRHNFGPSYPFGYNYKGPTYPFGEGYYRAPLAPPRHQYYVAPAPAYVAPARPAPQWVPGYWGQQWVPQYYTYDAWVPGYFARNGAWVQGYYEPRVAESGGYYERVWVDGYWTE
jgi:hypothetical protein